MKGLIKTIVLIGIMGFVSFSYASSNTSVLLPEIKALALDKLVIDRAGQPVTVLETPIITDSNGKIAQGLTEVTISLDSSSSTSLIILGKTLAPGAKMTVVQDLSATGGVIKIPAYPATSSLAGLSHYSLDIPKVTAQICEDSYAHDAASNTCQKVNTTSLLYLCPNSEWTMTGDVSTCRQQSQIAKVTCPIGFESNGDGTCTKTEFQNTVADCPAGYAYSVANDRCEKTLVESAYKTCSDPSYSYQASTNDCRKTVNQSVNFNCQAGYSFNPTLKICERTLTATASPVCGSGYTYSAANKRCEKTLTQTASKVCASGYSYSATNDRCEMVTTSSASPVCSSGYTYSATNSRCEKTVTETASKVCASGYSYSAINDRCEKVTTSSASPVCSSGYTYSATNGRCEKTVTQTASKVCASGYSYSAINDRCEKVTTSSASPVCSSGYTYSSANARCEKVSTITATTNCPSGSSETNGKCYESTAVWLCQNSALPDFDSKWGACMKAMTVSSGGIVTDWCKQTGPTTSQCYTNSRIRIMGSQSLSEYSPDGFIRTLTEVAQSISCPAGYTLSGSTCSQLQTEANTWSCPVGYSLNGSTCSLLQTQVFSYSCPAGYSLSGSTCSQLQTAANSWSCSAGQTLSGSTCSLLQTAAFSYNCPAGYSLSGSTCSQLQTAANTWSCPAGQTLSGSTCSLLQTSAFSYSCPVGYSLSGSTCSQLQTAANTWSCPANYANHNDGTCSWYQTVAYSLSCTDPSYTPNTTTEICEKVLISAHIYKCNNPTYTLSGASCSLLLTETENWICSDSSYSKISETQCRKLTDTDLVGTCPVKFVKSADGKSCTYSNTTSLIQSCPASYTLTNGECVKDVFKAPTCPTTIVDSSCTCDVGMSLNQTTWQCEGVNKTTVLTNCPVGYVSNSGGCTYSKTVDVVYDFCPTGMSVSGGNCVLTQSIGSNPSCNSPFSVQGDQCRYTDTKPVGYAPGIEAKLYEGDVKTELSAVKLDKTDFEAVVSEVVGLVVDEVGGCRLVATEALAKGAIKKGDVPCFVKWTSLPEGISAANNKVTGIFKKAGQYSLDYSLVGYNGMQLTQLDIGTGSLTVNVTEPAKPTVLDVTTSLMSKVVKGFEMYNYSAASKLNFTTVIVEPRTYEQKISIAGVGTCDVKVNTNSCSIYSNVSFTKDPDRLQMDSNYSILANSKIGGWLTSDLTPKDWVIHHDFRGPNIVFTKFNPTLESNPLVNTDLGFPVIISGGEGAVGINNLRSELASTDVWWKPSRVDLVFTAKDGTQSTNTLNIDGVDFTFDVPNNVTNVTTINSRTAITGENSQAFPFEMKTLTPGMYTVQVSAKDAYSNESSVMYENIEVVRPLPQIKVLHKRSSIEKLTSSQTINMLDDVVVAVHNGLVGDSKITSIKIDGKEALTTNSETYFKKLTSEGFNLEANTSYMMEITAEDKQGRVVSKTLPFNYLQMTFGLSRKPTTVIQKVEDIAITVNRTRGIRCDLYGTKAAATLASNDYNYACYIEWRDLPEGLTSQVTTFQSKLTGAVAKLGTNSLAYDAYIVNKSGSIGKVGSESVTFEAIAPLPIDIQLDEKQMLSAGVYSVPINDRSLGRYKGQSSRANIDVSLSNENGDQKSYQHNQLPFGEVQTFSAYAERLGDSVLWDKIKYTLKANYRLAPELSVEKDFDLIVTPHPYMQVIMDLDSPRYASTDSIKATIKLGLRNNMTGLFEYDEKSMGTGWDVFVAFKNGKNYEPITAVTQIGSDGTGIVELDANIIFTRNEAVYAVARARSPYPEINIERISTPRSITVVKGTGVEGKVVSRVVQSRIPANFDIRFDTTSFNDFMVLGDISWQFKDSTGNWVANPDFDDRQYVSIKSVTPETITVRAVVANKVTGVLTNSDEITLISYDVPLLNIAGSSQAIAGQEIELTALDNSDTPQTDAIVEWSVDNGVTWTPGSAIYNLAVGDSALKINARMKYANTSVDVAAGQWSQAVKYISVTKPKPLTVNVTKPNIAEIGKEIQLQMQIINPFVATGVGVHSEWLLPDGTVLADEASLTYMVNDLDLDASNRVVIKAKAWLDGYKDVTLTESNIVINTFNYEFPSESDLSLTVSNNIKFVPSTGYATLNMPYINAPGVVFSYQWTFEADAIKQTSTTGKSMNFTVMKAGVHKITLTLSDNRGNFAYIDGFADAIEPAPLEFTVNDVYSNKFMRAPLTISLYPSVKLSHPYDYIKEYVWTINGAKGEVSSRAVGVFEMLPVGHYDVELDVTSNFGQKGKYTASFDVLENKPPVCEPSVREQYGTHIVDANCKDSDGTISYYRWVVNGTVFSPYGAQVRFSQQDFPSASIVIEAKDDAGGVGVGRVSF
ncbi:Ig-like domain-containing protein [Shewanella oncorhynchi]|uniref:Ig-like domain-containing protein n=1 Tax=Shewanella oncorhynchi TaxID=2726434 RepID=UPI003D78BFCA